MSDTTTAPTTSVPAQAVPAGNQTHALEDLRRRVVGRLHTPADETWDAVRTPWVVNIQQHPMAVLEVRDADDVIAAVRWAVDHGCQVTAQPTGHGGLSTLDQTVLLRTRALGGIEIDVQRRTATIGSGVKAGELLRRPRGHRPDLPVRVQPGPVGHRHDHHRRDQLVRPRLRAGRRQHRQRRDGRRPRPLPPAQRHRGPRAVLGRPRRWR